MHCGKSKSAPAIGVDDSPDTGPGAQQKVVWPGKQLAPTASVFAMGKAAKPPSKRGGTRKNLPPIDPATLVFSASRPKPVNPFFTPRGRSKYAAIFDGLKAVGMSVEASIEYLGTLKSHAKKLAKAGKGRFSVLKVSELKCGVWREED